MEKIKVSKTFHYRKDGEWRTCQAGSVVEKDSVPLDQLEISGYEPSDEKQAKPITESKSDTDSEEEQKEEPQKKKRKGIFG